MVKNTLKGIKAYSGTFGLMSKLGLWKYFGVPMAISFLTATLIFVLAYTLADDFGYYISKIWIWEWGHETFFFISEIISGILILVLGLLLFKHIVMALSAPFMGPVSEKIENYLLGNQNQKHKSGNFRTLLWRGIRINFRNLLMELMLTIPIIIIGFVPILGIVSTVLLFLLQAYYAGFGNMDYTLERHFSYRESVAFVKKNRGSAIGNGIVFMLFLFIPIIGIILVLPLSVTAATTETISLLKAQNKLKPNGL